MQTDIVNAIRKAFDQLRFQFVAADRKKNSPTYAKNGMRVWAPCWREENDPLTGRDGWTKAINTTLYRVGKKFDSVETRVRKGKVDPTGACPNGGELLWDITWIQHDRQGRINDLSLVAESELKQTIAAIVQDFQKLLLADAGVRLMIIENFTDAILKDSGESSEGEARAPTMARHLAQHVKAFNRTKSENVYYLLVALDPHVPEGEEYEYHRIRYFRLKTDGTAVEWCKGEPSPFVANEP